MRAPGTEALAELPEGALWGEAGASSKRRGRSQLGLRRQRHFLHLCASPEISQTDHVCLHAPRTSGGRHGCGRWRHRRRHARRQPNHQGELSGERRECPRSSHLGDRIRRSGAQASPGARAARPGSAAAQRAHDLFRLDVAHVVVAHVAPHASLISRRYPTARHQPCGGNSAKTDVC